MKKESSLFVRDGVSYLVPFMLVSSLFFMWGFAHSILEVLNPHFQESFSISKTRAALVQAAVYGGYFLMALPAGYIIRRWGYRAGVLVGLLLYGTGALMFIPGAGINSFPFFVFSLLVIGCGLTCLETSANPYATLLGAPEGAERRINLSQSLNGIGWIVGPLVGGPLLFSGGSIAVPYAVVGVAVLLVALVFSRVRLPEVEDAPEGLPSAAGKLWNASFVFGLAALFVYVAAQTGVNSFFINYATENASLSPSDASLLLGFGGMGLFVAGRLSGSWLMGRVSAGRLLSVYSLTAALAMAVVVFATGTVTMLAMLVVYLCESIMFPTIFSLALRSSNGNTKRASSLLVMTIVGGAVAPLAMGRVADVTGSMAVAFTVPMICYIFIYIYSLCRK